MSVDGWHTLLVLGGIRSGKSEFAESLVRDTARVRYVATAAARPEDPEWSGRIERHRGRRPEGWSTEEVDADPSRLAQVLAEARPDETLLVDDLGGWVSVLLDPAHQPADDLATVGELAAAVRACAARLVLVSPEVGLTLVPLTPLGRAFTDALGTANQAVAAASDAVVLVVAGQPMWLKPAALTGTGPTAQIETGTESPVPANGRAAGPVPAEVPLPTAPPPTAPPPVVRPAGPVPATTASAGTAIAVPDFAPGMDLPMPNESIASVALDRLARLDFAGTGLGRLDQVVRFAAATGNEPAPAPWRSVRVLLIQGDHEGGAAAGTAAGESARQAELARSGAGTLASLAAEVGATLQVVPAPAAAPMELGPALTSEVVESALRQGWDLVARAAEDGVQVIVLAACGAGAEAAATAVLAATVGAEPAAVLDRVVQPGGQVDDAAWMVRCGAVRDALHRTRRSAREGKDLLAELAGGDIAVATGVLLAAAAHRLPVLLDGPVGIAAGLVSRDLGGQARHWCLLPDDGGHPGVRFGADVLDLDPLVDLRLGLGEGAGALTALPLLRSALILAAATPAHPALAPAPKPVEPESTEADRIEPDSAGPEAAGPEAAGPGAAEADRVESEAVGPDRVEPDSAEPDFVEPEPAGPGPARTAGHGG